MIYPSIKTFKAFLLLAFLGVAQLGLAQEAIFSEKIGLPQFEGEVSFAKAQDHFFLSFLESNYITVAQYDLAFNKTFEKRLTKEKESHVNFLDSYKSENSITYIFSNNSRKKYLGLTYNFQNDEVTEKTLDFKLEREKYLVNFSHKGKFYLLTQPNNTRKYKFYILDVDLNLETQIIDLDKSGFYKDGEKQETLPNRTIFANGSVKDELLDYGSKRFRLEEIKRNTPNLNEAVTYNNKIYVRDSKLLITLDSNKEHTVLIEINLKDSNSIIKQIPKLDFGENLSSTKTNSFILDDLLFLLKGDKKRVFVKLLDLKTNETKNVFSFHRNSPYLKERNALLNQNVVSKYNIDMRPSEGSSAESVQKRLQKIMKGGNQVGLRVLDSDQSFLLMLGGYKMTTSGPAMMPGGFGAAGGITMSFAFGNYTFVRDESLFFYLDKTNFDLDLSDFEDPYQQMEDYLNDHYVDKAHKKIGWKTKFQIDSDYYLGYLDRKENIYYIRKFK